MSARKNPSKFTMHTAKMAKLTITLRSQIEGYTCLLIFRNISILPAVIWAYPFINLLRKFPASLFLHLSIQMKKKNPSYLLLLESNHLLELKKNFRLPFY